MTYDEIAAALHISRPTVRMIERRALAKLRASGALRELWERGEPRRSNNVGTAEVGTEDVGGMYRRRS